MVKLDIYKHPRKRAFVVSVYTMKEIIYSLGCQNVYEQGNLCHKLKKLIDENNKETES